MPAHNQPAAPAGSPGQRGSRSTTMKTLVIALVLTVLTSASFYLSGHPLDVADYVVVLLAATLLAWTFQQYHRHHGTGH